MKIKQSVTAFFPAYNDEGSIKKMVLDAISTLKKITDDYEVIVVDDGSPDKSGKIADELAKKYKQVRVIHHKKNKGYGGALKSGFYNAKKDLIFYTDGDGQYDPKEMVKLFPYINDHDVVNGYKIKRSDSFYRIVTGILYNYLTRFLFNLKVKDVDCDFRLFHRHVFNDLYLESNSGSICLEMMKKMGDKGYKIKNIPVNHYKRLDGRSQFFKPIRITKTLLGTTKQWWKLVFLKNLGIKK